MSALGQAVSTRLGLGLKDVEEILVKHQVSTSVSRPTPAHVHFTRLAFSGTKHLTGVNRDGVSQSRDYLELVPFAFDWKLSTGLYGVGSDENLRGKSSTLRVLMWALRGRCDLKNEVRAWIDHVEVEISIDGVEHRVVFDVDHDNAHSPHGRVERSTQTGWVSVGVFAGDDQFEDLMGVTMMSALRLPIIAAALEGRRTQHAWPTYAGALLVRGDTLDYLLGEHSYGGLPARLLSLFAGAEWAAARAEATTAATVVETELKKLEAVATQQAAAMSEAHAKAVKAVEEARSRLAEFDAGPWNLEAIREALLRAAGVDAACVSLSRRVKSARLALSVVDEQLRSEQTRRLQLDEDARATLFFQQLSPTVCPRCAAPVTEQRRRAEALEHACSVCTSALDLDSDSQDLVVARAAADDYPHVTADSGSDNSEERDAGPDEIVDGLDALEAARTQMQQDVARLEEQLAELEDEREQLTGLIAASHEAQLATAQRQEAALALARAEGTASALEPRGGPVGSDQATISELSSDMRVLEAAKGQCADWVRDDQKQWLIDLGEDITALAREFGIANLTDVSLVGNATMKVHQGGQSSSYSACEPGEKLRLKLATAIALIKQGRTSGVGRHPGLLFVDSPGSQEMQQDDLDTMLEALQREATAADIQVLIGTRHTDELLRLLGEERCRLGRGTNYVW